MTDNPILPGVTGTADSTRILSRTGKYAGLSGVFEKYLVEAAAVRAEPESLDLEAFKKEFNDWIDTVDVHPSQAATLQAISIDDKAYEKMMTDPDFKKEVQANIIQFLGANFTIPPAFTSLGINEGGVYSCIAAGSAHWGWFAGEASGASWTRNVPKDESDSSADRAEAKRKKRKQLDELLGELAEERRLRRIDAAESYFYRFTAQSQGGMPYQKGSLYVSPPLDLSCLATDL